MVTYDIFNNYSYIWRNMHYKAHIFYKSNPGCCQGFSQSNDGHRQNDIGLHREGMVQKNYQA